VPDRGKQIKVEESEPMIEISKDSDCWTLTLMRPDKANALTEEMLLLLAETVEAANGQAKVLILTGTGKVFSAGADLEAAKAGLATSKIWERLSGAIANFPGLSIAALNGTVAGGAFGMVLACDIRLSVPTAKFFYPVMRLGFLPQPSDPKRMVALIGPSRAKMILMGGQKIEADEALSWGLIDRTVEPENLMKVAIELSNAVLSAQHQHINGIKSLLD
jgi:enoyl-CoA hydratase/carnithine racemase